MRHFLIASDFDQTLSFNDSGQVLSDLIGASRFDEKVAGLARTNLVQQGGELAYLIRHDPELRAVRREHLVEAGRRVRLRKDIPTLVDFLARGAGGCRFSFYVVSAVPREVVQAALHAAVPGDRIYGTEFEYDSASGEVRSILRVPAGYGKVAALEELAARLGIRPEHAIYVGDGSSDVHVMLHVNNSGGFTIAATENGLLAQIAKTTVLSESAFSITVPILQQVLGWTTAEVRNLFASYGLDLAGWEKARTDRITVGEAPRSRARPPIDEARDTSGAP